jgi:hypothetical protein
LFSNFALEYAIQSVQVNQIGLKLHGTYQLMVYADDVTKEIGVKVFTDEIMYMFTSPDENVG